MTENIFIEFFSKSIKCLNKAEIEFILVGGSTLPYYGNFRTTSDIDLMIMADSVKESKFVELINCFNNCGISITFEEFQELLHQNIHVSGIDTNSWLYRLDLKRIHTSFDYKTLRNGKIIELYGLEVPISSPESLVAIKISDGFQSNTDLEDILSIIETTSLDPKLLHEFLNEINSFDNFIEFLENCDTLNCKLLMEKMQSYR